MNTYLTKIGLGTSMVLGLLALQSRAADVNYDMSALTTGAGGTPAYLGNYSVTWGGYLTNPLQDGWKGQDVGATPGTATTVWNTNLGIYAGQKVMHGGYNGLSPNPISPATGSSANYNGKNFGVAYNQTGLVTTMLITFNVTNNVTPLGTGGGFNYRQNFDGMNAFFSNPATDKGVGMNLAIGGGGTSLNVGFMGVGAAGTINETSWTALGTLQSLFGGSAALTDWYSAKMVVDPTANANDGGATCYWKDETTNSAWVQVGATNIAIGRIANEGARNGWTVLTGVDLTLNDGVEIKNFAIKTPPVTTITPAVTVDYPANSTGAITVTSNDTWSASSDQAWAVVSPTSGSFNGTVTVTCEANPGSTIRTATVTVNGQNCTVSQAVAPANSTGTNITYDMSALTTGAGGSPAYLGNVSVSWGGYLTNPLQDNWMGQDVGYTPGTKTTVWNTNLGLFSGQKVMHGDYNGLNASPYGNGGSGSNYNGKDFVAHYNADGVTSVLQVTFNATNVVAPLGANGSFSIRQNKNGTNAFFSDPITNKGVGMGLAIGGNSSVSSFQFSYYGVGATTLDNTGFIWIQPSSWVSGASLTDWYTMKMVVNPMANGGQGGATCYWRDVTKNSGWIQVGPANQNIHRETETVDNTWSTMTGVDLQLGGAIEIRDFSITAGATSTSAPLTTVNVAAAANSTGTIAVTSNEVWNATSDSAWAVVSPAAGVSNGTVTVTCDANPDPLIRTAYVTINGNYVQVDQAAASGSNSYTNWMTYYTGADALPTANPTKDGINNLLKYALGLPANVPTGTPGVLSGKTITFTKGAMAGLDNTLLYSIQASTNLSGWTEVVPNNFGTGTISYDLSTGPYKFARLVVVQTP